MEFSFWAEVSAQADNIANPYLDSRMEQRSEQRSNIFTETIKIFRNGERVD